ncbi:exodeoxyribonuclease VII large subunit [archaeon]|nr:exodeoxyribonuclease VII large subunit [archaeon]
MKSKTLENIEKLYGIDKDHVLSVSQVSRHIKKNLTTDKNLSQIYVVGEVTNISKPSSGHIYFDIKDENSLLRCTLFQGGNGNPPFEIENGLDVLVLGSVSTYEWKSNYQLNVIVILPLGEGAFYLRYKQLKKKLEKEGLFDEKNKKKISSLPKSIGLITSKKGSTIKDVFKILRDRFSIINVKLISASMQGEKAAKEIIRAISILNQFRTVQTILIIRGGGSMEDLVCFNDENLARAIFNSKKPIITGIGHETDHTIADCVADIRAPTPSIAAKMVIADKQEFLDKIELIKNELERSYNNVLTAKLNKINNLAEHFQNLENGLKKSYQYYLKVKEQEREQESKIKRYKLIIVVIVVLIILYIIMKALVGG